MLLIVDHGSVRPWAWNPDPNTHFPTPEEVPASLDLSPERWRTEQLRSPERRAIGTNGQSATVTDNVNAVRRLTRWLPRLLAGTRSEFDRKIAILNTGTRADPRRWLVLAAIAASTLMVVLEVSIVSITQPHARTDPRIFDTEQHGVVTAYALAVGGYSCSGK